LDNRDITEALDDPDTVAALVDAAPDVLVAGFPCQDYSVANSRASGLDGDKGALWWQIVRVLQQLQEFGKPVSYLLLENVSQLLTSPRAHRGQDFAQILLSLQELGYAVTWRVVNASDYGFAQRRKRVYLSAVWQGSPAFAPWKSALDGGASATTQWLLEA
ncbi:DNA (cytosine-5-)-methyltransferase, partial [Arthrospira platensis SPKY1]|nr:DNA (cytosine-5-)-methyltransferase [Arthrospira platensis SPKY1]